MEIFYDPAISINYVIYNLKNVFYLCWKKHLQHLETLLV